jgi:hypothetical protein
VILSCEYYLFFPAGLIKVHWERALARRALGRLKKTQKNVKHQAKTPSLAIYEKQSPSSVFIARVARQDDAIKRLDAVARLSLC